MGQRATCCVVLRLPRPGHQQTLGREQKEWGLEVGKQRLKGNVRGKEKEWVMRREQGLPTGHRPGAPSWDRGWADAGDLVSGYTQLALPQTGSLTAAAIIWEH